MTLLWLLRVLPRALVSWFLLLLLFGLLPPVAERAAWTLCLALLLASAFPRVEGWSARLVEGARPPEAEERWHLAPVVARAEQLGVRVDRILIRRRPGVLTQDCLVSRVGRATVVVDPRVITGMVVGRITPAEATAALVHAMVVRPGLVARLDLVARVFSLPCQAAALACRVAFARVELPAARLSWRLRFVVAGVALVQGIEDGQYTSGVGAAVLVALTYLTPAADRAWQALRCAAADKRVTEIGMGPVLLQLLNRMQIVVSRRRLARLRTTSTEPRKLALPNVPIGGLPWTGYRSREAT